MSALEENIFITKAEFDSALADFNSRLTTFEAGINSKIDSQVSSYLDRNGIWNGKNVTNIYNIQNENLGLDFWCGYFVDPLIWDNEPSMKFTQFYAWEDWLINENDKNLSSPTSAQKWYQIMNLTSDPLFKPLSTYYAYDLEGHEVLDHQLARGQNDFYITPFPPMSKSGLLFLDFDYFVGVSSAYSLYAFQKLYDDYNAGILPDFGDDTVSGGIKFDVNNVKPEVWSPWWTQGAHAAAWGTNVWPYHFTKQHAAGDFKMNNTPLNSYALLQMYNYEGLNQRLQMNFKAGSSENDSFLTLDSGYDPFQDMQIHEFMIRSNRFRKIQSATFTHGTNSVFVSQGDNIVFDISFGSSGAFPDRLASYIFVDGSWVTKNGFDSLNSAPTWVFNTGLNVRMKNVHLCVY